MSNENTVTILAFIENLIRLKGFSVYDSNMKYQIKLFVTLSYLVYAVLEAVLAFIPNPSAPYLLLLATLMTASGLSLFFDLKPASILVIATTLVTVVFGVSATFASLLLYGLSSLILSLGMAAFTIGVSFIIATIAVFFDDITQFYSVIMQAMMYLTAIFYPIDIVPGKYRLLIQLNPMYHIVQMIRQPIYYGVMPSDLTIIAAVSSAVVAFVVGAFVFTRLSDRFVYYV